MTRHLEQRGGRTVAALLLALLFAITGCSTPQHDSEPRTFASVPQTASVGPTETIAHLSLHHAAKPRGVAAYVAGVVDEGATLITTTETNGGMVRAIRLKLGPEWRITRQGEYAIAWDRSQWRESRAKIQHLRRITYVHAGRDAWRDVYDGSRRLVHRETMRPVRVDVVHLPSAVQKGPHFRTDSAKQVRAWREGTHRLGRRAAGRDPGLVQLLAMDTNVDYGHWIWRDRMTDRIGMPSIWQLTQPIRGTHRGGRLIDAEHTTAPTSRARLVRTPVPPDVDHHGIRFRLHL